MLPDTVGMGGWHILERVFLVIDCIVFIIFVGAMCNLFILQSAPGKRSMNEHTKCNVAYYIK